MSARPLPELPDFSRFHEALRDDPNSASAEGHMRQAYYMAYDAASCERLMRKLEVKEIHGYQAGLGLKLLKPSALTRAGSARGWR